MSQAQDSDCFAREAVREGPRILIRSICTTCGASGIGSRSDGSLQTWEDAHILVCQKARPFINENDQ